MNRKILIKYSELTLKGKNRREFSNALYKMIKLKLNNNNLEYSIERYFDKIEIIPTEKSIEKYFNILKKISGISWYAEVISSNYSQNEFENQINYFLKDKINESFTFRVSGKCKNKKEFESSDNFVRFVATYVLKTFSNSKVSLKNYDFEIRIEINSENKLQTYIEKKKGLIGLPSGTNGKALTLLSGGIDSPVAAIKGITRGLNTSFITFLTPVTYEENTVRKIKLLAEKVNEYNNSDKILFLVNFKRIQQILSSFEMVEYRITLLRRYFLKFANFLADRYKIDTLITGDSLGQVASQTLESLGVIDDASERFVVRPLITEPKEKIICDAKIFETYEISNLPGDDMCSLFTPDNPVTKPKKHKVLKMEEQILNEEEIFQIILEHDTEIIRLGKKENE